MSRSQPSTSEPPNEVFEAFAAEPRRELLLLLGRGEASVTELAANFDISRPAVSKHLAVLRQAGLVDRRQEGRKHIYHLDADPLRELLGWLVTIDEFWAQELDTLGERLNDEEV